MSSRDAIMQKEKEKREAMQKEIDKETKKTKAPKEKKVKEYIDSEQPTTRYNLTSKFEDVDNVDVRITHINELTQEDLNLLSTIRLNVATLEPGQYTSNNIVIDVKNKI
jgi:mannose-6-phosphate isomerase class I